MDDTKKETNNSENSKENEKINLSNADTRNNNADETEEEGLRFGALRLLKYRHQSEAFQAQTKELTNSQADPSSLPVRSNKEISEDTEREEDGYRAEAIRRMKVRQLAKPRKNLASD